MRQMIVPVYAITLILSAFLLFSVQPMFARMILPLLGGSPSVWNTAMVFFQAALLAGYAYAHLTTRFLPARVQGGVHIALLLGGLAFLPFAIPAGAGTADASGNPVFWQLGVMLVALGLPFTVLSGTAPMVQRWFATTSHRDASNPYFLYAASNIGSLAALIAYPVVIEVFLGTRQQAAVWGWGYAILIAFLALSILMISRANTGARIDGDRMPDTPARPVLRDKLIWIALAFIPSSLMLSVTTYITTDIAAIPLLWVIPLAIYLGTFIIAFARRQVISLNAAYLFLCTMMTIAVVLFVRGVYGANHYAIFVYLIIFFLAALCAHLGLAARKPHAAHLTSFYLYISVGGVLGGVFNTLVAPIIFPVPFEFPLGLALALTIPFLAAAKLPNIAEIRRFGMVISGVAALAIAAILFKTSLGMSMLCAVLILGALLYLVERETPSAFLVAVVVVFLAHPAYDWSTLNRTLLIERNFFGVSKVRDDADGSIRTFMHGSTIHGAQALIPQYQKTPFTYYHPDGPAGDAFGLLDRDGQRNRNVAVLGLGAGSVACYAAPGRHFDFYEIDPSVIKIAQDKSLFTFLSDCGSPYQIIAGDGRLRIAEQPEGTYDMIFLDAFSSDSIPAHIVTREAFEIYFSRLKPGGFILANVSNRHLDINPLLAAVAEHFDATLRVTQFTGRPLDEKYPHLRSFNARYAIITRDDRLIRTLDREGSQWTPFTRQKTRLWTDDYANILSLFAH